MKTIISVAVIVLCLLLGSSLFSSAQVAARWAEAVEQFSRNGNATQTELRLRITNQLVEVMYPSVELEAVKILTNHLVNEINRSKGDIKGELNIKYVVLEACVNGLSKITQPKAIDYLLKFVRDEKTNNRVRFYVIQAMGGIDSPDVTGALVKLIDHTDTALRRAAFLALASLKKPDAADRACKLLIEPVPWEVKIPAVKYLTSLNNPELIKPLIDALQNDILEDCVRIEVAELLKQLAGTDLGLDGNDWLNWWKKKENKQPVEPVKSGETMSIKPILYYGITSTAVRVIFIIDTTGSMKQKASYNKDFFSAHEENPDFLKNADPNLTFRLNEAKKKLDARQVVTRLDAARKELGSTIYHLDPAVEFTLYLFAESQGIWKNMPVLATVENKISALTYLIQEHNVGVWTCFYEALEVAYKFVGREQKEKDKEKIVTTGPSGKDKPIVRVTKDKVAQFESCSYVSEFGGADTIFLVTDGSTDSGRLVDKKEIVNEMKKLSQIRGIKINTVAVGDKPAEGAYVDPVWGVNLVFLTNLAEATGGVFRDKTAPKIK